MRQFTDFGLGDHWKKIFNWLASEDADQIVKSSFRSHTSYEWFRILVSEVRNLENAIGDYEHRGDSEPVIKRSVGVATLAVKMAVMFSLLRR